MGPQFWPMDDGTTLTLLTPEQLKHLPLGARVRCINGGYAVYGRDRIDGDTRAGYLAYGLEAEVFAPKGFRVPFLTEQ